jgi:hypothetical protein
MTPWSHEENEDAAYAATWHFYKVEIRTDKSLQVECLISGRVDRDFRVKTKCAMIGSPFREAVFFLPRGMYGTP